MLITATVTFWRWLTGQPSPSMPPDSDAVPVEERRVCLRYAAALNVRCGEIGEEDAGAEARICNISRGGIQMTGGRRFEPGTHLSIELSSADGQGAMALLAYVVRAEPHGDCEWKMGCRFSSELNEKQLSAFGAARARAQAPDPRDWERFGCDAKAFYQRVNDAVEPHWPARVMNIAVGGMALLVNEPVVVGELLSTELLDAKGRSVVTILACVVHTQSVGEGQIVGCNFIRELSDSDIKALI